MKPWKHLWKVATPPKPNGWNLKITLFEKENPLPNLIFGVQNVSIISSVDFCRPYEVETNCFCFHKPSFHKASNFWEERGWLAIKKGSDFSILLNFTEVFGRIWKTPQIQVFDKNSPLKRYTKKRAPFEEGLSPLTFPSSLRSELLNFHKVSFPFRNFSRTLVDFSKKNRKRASPEPLTHSWHNPKGWCHLFYSLKKEADFKAVKIIFLAILRSCPTFLRMVIRDNFNFSKRCIAGDPPNVTLGDKNPRPRRRRCCCAAWQPPVISASMEWNGYQSLNLRFDRVSPKIHVGNTVFGLNETYCSMMPFQNTIYELSIKYMCILHMYTICIVYIFGHIPKPHYSLPSLGVTWPRRFNYYPLLLHSVHLATKKGVFGTSRVATKVLEHTKV